MRESPEHDEAAGQIDDVGVIQRIAGIAAVDNENDGAVFCDDVERCVTACPPLRSPARLAPAIAQQCHADVGGGFAVTGELAFYAELTWRGLPADMSMSSS